MLTADSQCNDVVIEFDVIYHDNVVLRMLASLSAVYYEYISLCSQYDIKDPLSSRMYIRESVWNAFCNRVF